MCVLGRPGSGFTRSLALESVGRTDYRVSIKTAPRSRTFVAWPIISTPSPSSKRPTPQADCSAPFACRWGRYSASASKTSRPPPGYIWAPGSPVSASTRAESTQKLAWRLQ